MKYFTIGFCATVILHVSVFGQEIEVALTERTTDDTHGVSLIAFSKYPSESLILPDVDTTHAFFTSEFSRQRKRDETVSILVVPDSAGEWLYIDVNNDNDLTNDGDPIFFSAEKNEIVFHSNATPNPGQEVRRSLSRFPSFILGNPDDEADFRQRFLEEDGNLKPPLLKQPKLPADFTGRKGTFYFPGRLSLRRGFVSLDGEKFDIGLYDYSENGRFDDPEDLLYLDLNGDKILSILWTTEVFKLSDIIAVGDMRYKIVHVDPYGKNMRIAATDDEATRFYVSDLTVRSSEGATGRLDRSFWDLELQSTSGKRITISDFRGYYLLLNFWGEWCAPCIQEIPALIAVYQEFSRAEIEFIGILNTFDQSEAESVIEENGMHWPQVILTEDLQERFKIMSYPTNLLVFPDGETYLQMGQLSEDLIRQSMD